MLHDLVIVGAGPVGATLALALADSDLDVVTLDARPAGSIVRSDRSLALSHGTRLVFERLGVWNEVTATPGAVTPITDIDISQRGGFGRARLHARDHGVDALGYVVSYRALQHALDSALGRAGMSIEHGVDVTRVSATTESAHVVGERSGAAVDGAHVWRPLPMVVARSWTTVAPPTTTESRWWRGSGRLGRTVDSAFDALQTRSGGTPARRGSHGLRGRPLRRCEHWSRCQNEGFWKPSPSVHPAPGHGLVLPISAPSRWRLNSRPASPASAPFSWVTQHRRCIPSPVKASISAFATHMNWRKSCLRPRPTANILVRLNFSRRIHGAVRPIVGPASHSRTVCSGFLERTLRCCAGRAGWRLLFSTRCRRSSECSRARCCMACIENLIDIKRTDERADYRAANWV